MPHVQFVAKTSTVTKKRQQIARTLTLTTTTFFVPRCSTFFLSRLVLENQRPKAIHLRLPVALPFTHLLPLQPTLLTRELAPSPVYAPLRLTWVDITVAFGLDTLYLPVIKAQHLQLPALVMLKRAAVQPELLLYQRILHLLAIMNEADRGPQFESSLSKLTLVVWLEFEFVLAHPDLLTE